MATTVVYRQAGEGATEPGLPEYAPQQQSGGFMDWVREHKVLVIVVLGGAGLLLLIYLYNQGNQQAASDTSTTDTGSTPTDNSETAGLQSSGYGAPDWSPVANALSGLQSQESQDTQSILSALQSQQTSSTGAAVAAPSGITPQAPAASSASWSPQPIIPQSGESTTQASSRERQGCIDYHRGHECKSLKGSKKTQCEQHWTEKCGARHPQGGGIRRDTGGAFKPASSLSLRSMHMNEPGWRSLDHQGIFTFRR